MEIKIRKSDFTKRTKNIPNTKFSLIKQCLEEIDSKYNMLSINISKDFIVFNFSEGLEKIIYIYQNSQVRTWLKPKNNGDFLKQILISLEEFKYQ